eukprot:16433347-Heterocapsa_arctica.AAC.1
MCADVYTKAFTDAAKWVEVCDLINIVDPKPLLWLIQHTAEVVAGLTHGVIPMDNNTPPPCGGDTEHNNTNKNKAIPAVSKDATYTLSDSGRAAFMNLMKDMTHGTRIGRDVHNWGTVTDNLKDNKILITTTIINLLIGVYIGDLDWNYVIIGNDELGSM